MENYFEKLNTIPVKRHIEKKGEFTYLSWPYAVQQLRLADPTASWEVRRFDGLPYLKTETGYFVEVAVTVQGITLSQIHPVLDTENRPIPAPTCFEINTSIQRALVKAIALHGLGLCVYAGEDLPKTEKVRPQSTQLQPHRYLSSPRTVTRVDLAAALHPAAGRGDGPRSAEVARLLQRQRARRAQLTRSDPRDQVAAEEQERRVNGKI